MDSGRWGEPAHDYAFQCSKADLLIFLAAFAVILGFDLTDLLYHPSSV